ncbi:terpene synthase family protein [Aspergillus brunneoviolaceus CBS 621.78]|uniref:Terpenoid synthase n=1 Tax=Aspergillus brunneoviolaceus CBS 621.78 TaxID=1450534 RepID=A0ACD1FSA2_9EURO|nr:terpenoid synthase [Aspergillus brunneoviolaceus CBS 621.78]RAH39862.1 terpenoid synthase [Aspergillus brunneoviolaceus CBS 621.78]
MVSSEETLALFRQTIRGQTATLPDLYALFPEWKAEIHPDYERARDEVLNPWIERWVPNRATSRKFRKADFGVFAAIFCVRSSFEVLCTVSKAFAWYFIWDDIFDLRYFHAVLGEEEDIPDLSYFSEELQFALLCWNEVADHIRHVCSKATLKVLLDQKLYYVESVDTVDTVYSENHVPSLKQYLSRRERTAGVYPVIATIPFIYDIDVSQQQLDGESMQLLWKRTSYLADGQIENLIPVLMLNEGVDCNTAMKLAIMLVDEAAHGFHETEKHLRAQHDSAPHEEITEAFLEGCKNVVMGLTYWSYTGQRYFHHSEIEAGNTIRFSL